MKTWIDKPDLHNESPAGLTAGDQLHAHVMSTRPEFYLVGNVIGFTMVDDSEYAVFQCATTGFWGERVDRCRIKL